MRRPYQPPQGKPTVALIKYEPGAVARAIEMSQGLTDLRPGHRVLLKPNLVAWDDTHSFPPYGVLTTTALVEQTLAAVKEAGVRDITIGEGSIVYPRLGCSTKKIYQRLGYERLVKRYGVKLADFNEGPFEEIELAGQPLELARAALETDFLINLPVLKTHAQTKVSLGIKNLKGALRFRSKKACHRSGRPVDDFLVALAELLAPDLTIIDGIYRLAFGAMRSGSTKRADLIIAGRDVLAPDLVGAHLLGYPGSDVLHMADFARAHGSSTDLADIEIKGLVPDEHVAKTPYDMEWNPDNTMPMALVNKGLEGLHMPKYDMTLCSGCSLIYAPLLTLLISAHQGRPFPGYEFLTGKEARPRPGYEKTFLCGNCQIKRHRKHENIKEAVFIKGCPPSVEEMALKFQQHGVPAKLEAVEESNQRLKQKYSDASVFKPEDYWE